MSLRIEIATKIFCAAINANKLPDIEGCFSTADDILAHAKEQKGFFIDVQKYEKAVKALKEASEWHKKDDVNGFAGEICMKALIELGEM